MGKNLKEIQSMIDGRYERKIQVGYTGKTQRKEGEKWTDGNGTEWEIVNGKRKQITNIPAGGFDKCSDCNKLIFKQRDEDTYNRMGRCYYCQINFEVDLKVKPIRWFAWRRLKDFQNMEAIESEMEQWLDERKELLKDNPFDETIANAIANSNVEMTINKNKTMTN